MLTKGRTITIPAEDRFDASHDTDLLLTEDPAVHPNDDWIRVKGVDLGAAGSGAGHVTDGVVTVIVRARLLRALADEPTEQADPAGSAMREEGPFYLDGLLFCHAPMRPATWRRNRGYRCPVCQVAVDALGAEVEVWEMARTERPALGTGHTPYADRADLLADVLETVLVERGRYKLGWREHKTAEHHRPY